MRVVIDLGNDAEGRPVGTVHVDGDAAADTFTDWLDLLRLIESCTHRSQPAKENRP